MIANAMAREIVMGGSGKAEAVSYIDKTTRTEQRVYAKAVVVAASACESARLLLNSRSAGFPNGLANSSGAVGRYLMDSVGSDLAGYFPQLENMPVHNHDGVGGMHLYMPWWRFGKKNEFLRGYHIEFGGGRDLPGVGSFEGVCEEHEGYGVSLKQKCRSSYGTVIGFSGRGEMIPNDNSFCDLDPEVKDMWGNLRRGAVAKTRINRGDFGLTFNAPLEGGGFLLSDEVGVEIDIQMTRKPE